MKKCKLGELIEFQRGYDLPKTKAVLGKYKVITSNGIMTYHNEKKSGPSIVIGRSGTIGKPQLIEEDFWPHNTTLFAKDLKGNNIKYLYYLLINLNIDKMKSGSNIPTLNRNHLHPLEIYAEIDVKIQEKIANILCVIDKKIIINKKINNELEQLSKTIYDYWFLQFDFPDENGRPYKSSGGKMVWNKILKREIPEGWEVKELNEILSKNNEAFDYQNEEKTLDLSVMPSNTFCLSKLNVSSNFSTNLFKMEKGNILFGTIRPYLKKAGIAPCNGAVAGTVLSYFVKDEKDFNYALLIMTSENFFNYAIQNSKGTKMPVIGHEELMNYKIPYNKKIITKFNQLLNLKDIICHNIMENQELKSLRDFLLPLLMNGQVTFKKYKKREMNKKKVSRKKRKNFSDKKL